MFKKYSHGIVMNDDEMVMIVSHILDDISGKKVSGETLEKLDAGIYRFSFECNNKTYKTIENKIHNLRGNKQYNERVWAF